MDSAAVVQVTRVTDTVSGLSGSSSKNFVPFIPTCNTLVHTKLGWANERPENKAEISDAFCELFLKLGTGRADDVRVGVGSGWMKMASS